MPIAISAIPAVSISYIITSHENTENISESIGIEEKLSLKTGGYNDPEITAVSSIVRRTGYNAFIEFTVNDDDLDLGEDGGTYNITGNVNGDFSGLGLNKPWKNGIPISHPIGYAYTDTIFTIDVVDNDGRTDQHVITATFNDYLAYIECITIEQDGVEYNIQDQVDVSNGIDYEYRDFLSTGDGPFKMNVYWQDWSTLDVSHQVRKVECDLSGYLDYYGFAFYIAALGSQIPLHADALSTNSYHYELSNAAIWKLLIIIPYIAGFEYRSINTFQPANSFQYEWNWWFLHSVLSFLFPNWVEYAQDIPYIVENRFAISVETGRLLQDTSEHNFIYNQQVRYGSLNLNIDNRDITAPTLVEINHSQADSDSNYEIICDVEDEYQGSGVNDNHIDVYYSVDGGAWGSDNMVKMDDGYFHGNIPPPPLGSTVRYYVKVEDMEGNIANSDIYSCYAQPYELPQVLIALIGVLAVTIGAVAVTLIYRKRNKPAIITLPSKKKVDKYYKKINKEEG